MIRNYFKIAIRNLSRSKGFTFINVSGLAVGMASAILIFLWIHNETNYDQFHVNKDNIYQAWNRGTMDGKVECWPHTPKVLGPTLKEEYPEVADISRTFSRWFVAMVGEKKISSNALITDPSFLSIFTFPVLHGDIKNPLKDGHSIVITRTMSLKMFDTEDATGKEIKINEDIYKVTAVLKDLPVNSSFDFEYLLSWDYFRRTGQDDREWANNSVFTYVLLQPGHSLETLAEKIKRVSVIHSQGDTKEEIFLHPLNQWHLYSKFENGKVAGGRIEIVRLFALIGIFILMIACINFMNLSTARSEKRAKEVGVRKVAGAYRGLLVAQFLVESVVLAFLSGAVALMIVQVALPYFNVLVNQQLHVPHDSLYFWLTIIAFITVTGFISGSYPAFFLSSFKPVSVLKGTFRKSFARINPRKVLVVVQFSFAVTLIICTLIVVQQIRFAQDRDRGYEGSQLLYHWMTGDLHKNYISLKNELINTGIATHVTKSGSPLSAIFSNTWDLEWRGKIQGDKTIFERFSQDEGLIETAGLQLVQGRDMDLEKYPTDSTAMVINESAAKAMGFENPIGEVVKETDGTRYHIVGVVKDFIITSPYERIRPLVIEGITGSGFNVINIRLKEGTDISRNIKSIQTLFERYNPEYPFEYHFVDADYQTKFEDTERIATLTSVFAVLTIFISCLGLFGLATYMAEVRIKEIGIRKVLGASVVRITALLSKDFLTLVLIAVAVAVPVAWYVMDFWLQHFTYRVTIEWWVFILSGAICTIIALLTVSYQSIKAALADPVKSLRSE